MLYGIALVDVHALTTRYARSALPAAPVIEDELRRRLRRSQARRSALGSRSG
jgi:hypothetical protein